MQIYKPGAAPEQIFPLQKVVGFGITQAAGKSPPNGQAGFSPGCLFHDLDGDAGEQLLINEGTKTSAAFNAIGFGDTAYTASSTEVDRAFDTSTRVVDCTTATLAVTVDAHDGKIITLNRAAGIAVTLPDVATSSGAIFTFIIGTTFTGAASIKSALSSNHIFGHASMGNNSNNSTVDWQSLDSDANDTIDLFTTGNTTGGFAGQRITLICMGAWWAEIRGDAAGTEATPFQNTV